MLNAENIYEVIEKLVGPIDPVGETTVDEKRFENLKTAILIVDKMIYDICFVSRSSISHEHSVKRSGEHAKKYLEDLSSEL
jgi:hypothetical protein